MLKLPSLERIKTGVKRSVEQHLLDTATISFEKLVVLEQLRDVSERLKNLTDIRKVKCKTK